jgi:hypothetical protein
MAAFFRNSLRESIMDWEIERLDNCKIIKLKNSRQQENLKTSGLEELMIKNEFPRY